MSLAYRRAEERDTPLIVDAWLESYRNSHAAGMVQMNAWRDVMGPQVEAVLNRAGVQTWVAFKPGADVADLYGWIATERDYKMPVRERINGLWEERLVPATAPLVHYVYVKQAYRRLGIARGLFRNAGVDPADEFIYSCKTPVVATLSSKVPLARWNPLICRYPKT